MLREHESAVPQIHPTAIIESGVEIGPHTAVWDGVHIRGPAQIGHDCIIGEKTYIAYGVTVGSFVKINAQVYVCTGVTIEDQVMVAAGVIFTNDRFPRAFDDTRDGLAYSGVTADTLRTTVRRGATLGAGAVIGPGIEIGAFSLIGMGSVVVSDVPAHALAYGNPAHLRGYVCVCGVPLRPSGPRLDRNHPQVCARCGRTYRLVSHGPAGVQLLIEQ
jgi:UDP-2-acetamido-3-amino-2,3-dideoxy-glucuronate N-acetyltransferase